VAGLTAIIGRERFRHERTIDYGLGRVHGLAVASSTDNIAVAGDKGFAIVELGRREWGNTALLTEMWKRMDCPDCYFKVGLLVVGCSGTLTGSMFRWRM
jgi:hypothetical protein